jgi:hypothetical protein
MKKRVRIYKKPCYECGGQTHMKSGGQFEPHIMFDPKTGKGYPAETMEDHLAMKEQGFLHKDEMPKKQFGGNQFSKKLGKELPQNQNTDEVVGERKNIFVSSLSNNAFKKYAEEEQQSLQDLHQQMKMGGNTSYGMYDQYGGQYPTNEYMPKMIDGGDAPDPTDPYYIDYLLEEYSDKFGTTAVKGFGDYDKDGSHPLLNYANDGETRRAAVIRYMEAMLSDDKKNLMETATYLDETDLPDLMSWGWLPGSDEDKLDDMAGIAREQARGYVYEEAMAQIDDIDSNFKETSDRLERELRKKQADTTLSTDELKKVNADLEKLKRIKGIVAKDKRNEVVNYHLKGQIDWDNANWGQAYVDYLDIYNNTFGKRNKDGNWIEKPLNQYDLLENISPDLRNSTSGSPGASGTVKVKPFSKRTFINDDSGIHTQTDNYLKELKSEKVDKEGGKQKTDEVSFTENEKQKQEEAEARQRALKEQERARAEAAQPKPVQPKPVQQQRQPAQPKPAPTYQPNVVKSKQQSGATDEDLELLLQVMGEEKKYGGNIDMYQDGGQPEDYMNVPGDAFEDLKWYDKQTTGFDKYQVGREYKGPKIITAHSNPYLDELTAKTKQLFNNTSDDERATPFRNLTWKIKEGVNNMFTNPNKDYGYSTADGTQIRMNRKGDEKIDLMGTYANNFRQNPLGTVGRTLGNFAQTAAPIARDISRMREDNRYDAFNQKMKMADNQFSPVDNPQERGNWTTNQGYFNPDLMTMQPWFTGQNYQYGGDVVEMTDMEIEEFLRAGGQIEYLD